MAVGYSCNHDVLNRYLGCRLDLLKRHSVVRECQPVAGPALSERRVCVHLLYSHQLGGQRSLSERRVDLLGVP